MRGIEAASKCLVFFRAEEEKKTDEEEEKGGEEQRKRKVCIFAHCQIKAEPDWLCVRQTEGRVPQTVAVCPLFSFPLSDRGLCDVSAL